MSKAKIIDKKSVDSILGEKYILSIIHHPFIVNMIFSFQDHDYLYLVMDLLPGGNLRYHLSQKKYFNEIETKFLIACILVGLEYIHSEKILHRDIKPENLVFDYNGYLRITDFGIAKKYVINNKKDTSGTVGYLAPEVLCNENHTFSIDYYAVGIITYELTYGHRPYLGKNKHEVKQLILTKQAKVDYDELPDDYHDECADFINELIQRKPKKRLGKNNIYELIKHPWFEGFDWENLKLKKLKAEYIPKIGDNFDKKYCLASNKIGTDTLERYKEIIKDSNYDNIFKNFSCDKIPEEFLIVNKNNKYGDGAYNNSSNNNNSTNSISRVNNAKNNQNIILEQQKNKESSNNVSINGFNSNNNNNIINNNNKNHHNYNNFNSIFSIINKNKSMNNINNYNSNFNNYNKFLLKSNNNDSIVEISRIINPQKEKEKEKENVSNYSSFEKINNKNHFNKITASNSISTIHPKKFIFSGLKKDSYFNKKNSVNNIDNLNNILYNNKLNGSNSTNELLKKNNLILNYNAMNKTKKTFLKKELLNGSLNNNKYKKRKSSASLMSNNSKNNSVKSNKRMKSSYSMYNITKQNPKIIKSKSKVKIINNNKLLPFINISLSKTKKKILGFDEKNKKNVNKNFSEEDLNFSDKINKGFSSGKNKK